MKPQDVLARAAQRAVHAKTPESWWKVTAAAAEAGKKATARVQIFGAIGDWWEGLDAASLATAIQEIDADQIEVHLNSPGGIAFDGIAIMNTLRQHKAQVRVVVDGLAASAASIVAMAGDEIVMAPGSQMMIHNASGLCFGQAGDMRQVADVLDKISGSIASVYANRAGGTADDWRGVMDAETWYSAEEAVEAGLADAVDKTAQPDEQAKAAFDLTIFAYAGRQNAPKPAFPVTAQARAPHEPPAEPPADHTTPNTEGADMSDTLTSGLRARLGISADAELDESGLLAALDEALAEQTEPTPATASIPAGTVLVDEGTLSQLQASAQLGRQAHERQVAADREQTVQNAVASGRIPAARKDHWLNQLKADPGAAEVLNGLPANTIPMEPVGYTGGQEEAPDDDAYPSNWIRR